MLNLICKFIHNIEIIIGGSFNERFRGLQNKKTPSIAMIMMVIMSFSNLFGLNIAGLSVVIGVVIFFINGALEKRPISDNGLDIKGIGDNLKDKKIWFWILLPLAMDIICLIISKLFLPEYIEYEMIRAGSFVAMELTIL